MDMNELVNCPFDINHKVSRRRLQYHLAKCVKTYTGPKLQCPYNACEFLHPEEFEEHFKFCKSRGDTVAQHFSIAPERNEMARRRNLPAPFPFHHPELPDSDDRWGLD